MDPLQISGDRLFDRVDLIGRSGEGRRNAILELVAVDYVTICASSVELGRAYIYLCTIGT